MRRFSTIIMGAIGAASLPFVPVSAQSAERDYAGFTSVSTALNPSIQVRIHRRHDRRGHFDHRGNDRNSGDAYFPYREYQGDTLWRSDGFNDWWHDRPDRAFPRWVSSNQNCERQWWSGSGWRC